MRKPKGVFKKMLNKGNRYYRTNTAAVKRVFSAEGCDDLVVNSDGPSIPPSASKKKLLALCETVCCYICGAEIGISEKLSQRNGLVCTLQMCFNCKSEKTFKTSEFQYTATQRTGESARYFTIGLFGRSDSMHVWFPEPLARDPVLRFYKLCDRWRTQVDKNPATVLQKRKFERSPEVLAALKRITTRLGLNGTIGVADAEVMYLTCTFETAWEKRGISPWCSVFSEEDLKVFEYSEDLKYYWVDGYGYELTYKQACPALKDMMEHLQPSPEKESEKQGTVVYFSHSGTMLKMLCHLGLYKDSTVLLHSNYETMANQRKWRVGKIDSFGSNLAFVLFQCGNEPKLMTLHQERPVVLPGCPQDLLCPVALFRQLYNDSLENCKFTEMCAL